MGEITHLDEFSILYGFKLAEVYETLTSEHEAVIIMKFVNDKNVAIDVDFYSYGELRIREPYAVDDEYLPLKRG